MSAPMEIDLPYLMPDTDRHGNPRLYVRKGKHKIRIRETPGTPAFLVAYKAALDSITAKEAQPVARRERTHQRGTLGWLAALYKGSDEFRALDAVSQRRRSQILEGCLDETIKDGSTDTFRDCPLGFLTSKKMKRLRDLKAGKPGAANNRRKYLSAMFGWAIEAEHISTNPVRDVRRIKYTSSGFHTWTLEEVAQYRTRWAIGTQERLALEMLLFIGVRRGDFVQLGPQHVRDGGIRFVPRKTKKVKPEAIEVPMLACLQRVIDATPTGALAFFVTSYGKPFSAAGFGNWFAAACIEAKVPGRAHGLRKAGATIAADEGATVSMLMAMYGWSTPAQAIHYTKKADQKRLAREGMALLEKGGL